MISFERSWDMRSRDYTTLLAIICLHLSSAVKCFADDEVASYKACLERERNAIYNNTKLCAVGNPVDLTGGTEGEGIAKNLTCAAKDYALTQIAEKCRKQSFIVQTLKPKIVLDGTKTGAEFIDGGTTYQPPQDQYQAMNVAKGPKSAGTTTIPKARLAKAVGEDDEEGEATFAAKAAPKASTAKKALDTPQESGGDDSDLLSTKEAKGLNKSNADQDASGRAPTNKSSSKDTSTDDQRSDQSQIQRSPSSSNPNSNSTASSANVDADLASCRQAQSKAQTCCGSPASCLTGQDRASYYQLVNGSSDDDDGLTDTCERLNRATALSGDLNGKVAALCTNNQYACQNTCAGLVAKYQNLIDSCGDSCDNYSTYQDAISTMQSQQATCATLSAKADALSIQSLSSGSDQGMAAACQQRASASPSSMSAASVPSGSSSSGQAVAPSGAPAATNSAGAVAATSYASASATPATLSAGGAAPTAQLSPAGDPGGGGTYYGQAQAGAPAGAASVRPVPNAGGGGFGLGQASAGRPTAGGPNRPSPGNSLVSTDIDQGFRSGGYTQEAGPGDVGGGPAGGAPRRGLASVGDGESGYEGMDLKQYLPGGAYYRAGGMDAAGRRSEINGKEEDLFQRVSAKFLEKCKLGVLWRCQE